MTMNKKRHDDRPERRRSRYQRLAVLGFLTLGSNLGCGQNMLRLPAGSNGMLLGPTPIPYSAAANAAATTADRKSETLKPVAIKPEAGYGSSVEDLFLASYRDTNSYGPHRTKSTVPQPSHGESLLPGGLLAASREAGIALPNLSQGSEAQQTALFSEPPDHARQRYRDPADSSVNPTRIPPPRPRMANPANQARAGSSSGAGPMDLAAACGQTKIAPPKRDEPTYFPGLEAASQGTGIEMPVPHANNVEAQATTPTGSQPEIPSPPPPVSEPSSLPTGPVEVQAESTPPPETATPPTPTELPMDPPGVTETSVQAPVTPETPAQSAASVASPVAPPAPAETPSQPAPALELPAEPKAPVEEQPGPTTAPVDQPPQPPPLAEPSEQPAAAVDLLADPLALPDLPSQAATPTAQPAAAEMPSEPATPAALPSQPQPLPAEMSQTPPVEMPSELPPLAAIATEPAVPTEETKVENPRTPIEAAGTSPPSPSKPGSLEPSSELNNVAFEETKIPPPGQAIEPSQGGGPEQIPLPPLQMDPSVFETSAELPPPLPLATPSPKVAANPACAACEILRKQKESDHWTTGPVKQTISCPNCEESEARSRAKAKAGPVNRELRSGLKGSNIAPTLSSAKVNRKSAN